MARTRTVRLAALALSNILLPIAVLVFASGFFPYKPFLPGLATFENAKENGEGTFEQPEAIFDRVIFMVVDALRSDFVYGYNSGFEFTQSLIQSGAAIPFTAHATPPTVTMPRVKALTTGSVPSFLDLILNFAESDTSSSLATQDTWLAQIRAKGGKLVFYGDDTWLKLFPGEFFARADGTSSFFVSDFTEVDNNVTRHVPRELANDDWNAMIMHYLGLDHIGHKTGPQGPNMLPKQREMDGIVEQIYEAMESQEHHEKTLLVLAGDHGMNAGGNHGGSGPGETEPALLFASPKFKQIEKRRHYSCPTAPKDGTEFHYYTKIEQGDIVPAIAGMMGMPISKNSLGVLIPELAGLWSESEELRLLRRNADQMLHIIRAKYGADAFDQNVGYALAILKDGEGFCTLPEDDQDRLERRWAEVMHSIEIKDDASRTKALLYGFLNHAQAAMSDTASTYDIPRMVTGMVITTITLALTVFSFPSLWPPSLASSFFAVVSVLYGIMMFASSYVEEEQHFWYWLTPAWITLLTAQSIWKMSDNKSRIKATVAGITLLATHRIAVRWNQTGQKHAGEPDIVHTVFTEHHVLMWLLILAAYLMNGFYLHNRTFASIFMAELTAFTLTSLVVLGIVFKLNFTQADAPELVQGLAARIREYSEPFSLVMQARAVFAVLGVSTVAVVVLSVNSARLKPSLKEAEKSETQISLPERLHHLLTLFLMTQTRAPNVPLFILMELQQTSLGWLLAQHKSIPRGWQSLATPVATSALLFSNAYYFCVGGSNSISSIDLSNAYNGVADYNIAAVGLLLFAGNWAGPIWWCSAAVLLLIDGKPVSDQEPERRQAMQEDDRGWVMVERAKLHEDAIAAVKPKASPGVDEGLSQESWWLYVSVMTTFIAVSLLAVMAACTALRTHLFIWTVFSPKYLYAMAWAAGWHLLINIGFGSLLYQLRGIA